MKMKKIPVVVGAIGKVQKGLGRGVAELEIGDRIETIQTIGLLRSSRILRRVLET